MWRDVVKVLFHSLLRNILWWILWKFCDEDVVKYFVTKMWRDVVKVLFHSLLRNILWRRCDEDVVKYFVTKMWRRCEEMLWKFCDKGCDKDVVIKVVIKVEMFWNNLSPNCCESFVMKVCAKMCWNVDDEIILLNYCCD